VNQEVRDTAALHDTTGDAGGTVSYNVYTDSACTTGHMSAGTVTVTSGQVPQSALISFATKGTYYFQAAYTGDGNNLPAKSDCTTELLTVKLPPSGPPQTGEAIRHLGGAPLWALGLALLGACAFGAARHLRNRANQ
jgi:hypothetical protein